MNRKELEYMKDVIEQINSDDEHLMIDCILGEMYYFFRKQYNKQIKKKEYE
jgi:hypothetical protein